MSNLRNCPIKQTAPKCLSGPLPKSYCPCGYQPDDATEIGGDSEPAPGDIGLCFNCGRILEYNDILVLQPIANQTAALDELSKEARDGLFTARAAIRRRGRIR